ncbi:MAG: GNAT family N-acetyltransferase [Ruminococcaceae bacterium]|nr:GNAT family N-acetyltransferase [Oscillospiraceae bacterium]
MRIDIRPAVPSDTEKIRIGDFSDVFVLLCDGEITAVCAARNCEKPFEDYAEITLSVLPEWQRKGLGKKLLSHTLRKLRGNGYKGAMLEIAEDNVGARRFYEKFGFSERNFTKNRKPSVVYTIDF